MGYWYCTREDVKSLPEIKATARMNAVVDRAIEAASRRVEGLLHRVFYPEIATRYFSWPTWPTQSASWKLYLDANELASVTSLTSDGLAITDYFLEPQRYGPPYDSIELDRGTSTSFTGGSTPQRNIAVTGVYCGCAIAEESGPLTAEALDASEVAVDVTFATVGVGAIIRVDNERMIVTGKRQLTTAQTIQANLAAQNNAETVSVTDGTQFAIGEQILIDSEYMLVVDVAGNNLIVKRASDGSTLAAHTSGTTIYAPRTLIVTRGSNGTSAATHEDSSLVYVYAVPGPVKELTIAETLVELQNQSVAYLSSIGGGENAREARRNALNDLREQVYTSHGRKARMRSV